MKHFFFTLSVLSILILSCSKENDTGGKQDVSPTIVCMTSDATGITQTSAMLNGSASIKNAKESEADAYFYYSTTQGDAKTLKSSGQRVSAGKTPSSGGDFSYNLSNLTAATTYYYVASVSIDDVEELGNVKSFTTADKPTELIITGEYSNLGESSVKLYGICNQEGEAGLSVVYGIEYSKTDLTTDATSVTATEKDNNNKFCCQISDLVSNTLYYYRAYALFNGVRYYGKVESFTTKDFSAVVTTNAATDITELRATLNCSLSVTSIESLQKSVWFLYSNTASDLESLKSSGSKISCTLNDDGTAAANLTGLSSNTPYYYVSCAKVHDKIVYGEVKSFTTKEFSAVVTTNAATDITEFEATINCSLSVTSIESLQKSVWFLYSNTASDLESLKSSGSKISCTLNDDGTAAAKLTGLSSLMQYYYVSCAKVQGKIVYGEVKLFTTIGLVLSPESAIVGCNVTSAKFQITSNVNWTVVSETSGFTVSPASGNGNGEVTVNFAANTNPAALKVATIKVSSKVGDKIFTLTQYNAGLHFEKVTAEQNDWTGEYLIVYEDGTKAFVFNGEDEVNGYVEATISSGVIAFSDALDAVKATVAKMDGGYSVCVKGNYLSGTSGSNVLNRTAEPTANAISYSTEKSATLVQVPGDPSTLQWNNASYQQRFRYYGSAKQKDIQLYKLKNK